MSNIEYDHFILGSCGKGWEGYLLILPRNFVLNPSLSVFIRFLIVWWFNIFSETE